MSDEISGWMTKALKVAERRADLERREKFVTVDEIERRKRLNAAIQESGQRWKLHDLTPDADRLADLKQCRESLTDATCPDCSAPFRYYRKVFYQDLDADSGSSCEWGYVYDIARESGGVPKYCLPCSLKRHRAAEVKKRLSWFESENPAFSYYLRKTNTPPKPAQHALVMAWDTEQARQNDKLGLILHGGTGMGKTTSLYCLFHKLAQDHEETPRIVSAVDLKREISEGALENNLSRVLRPYRNCWCLAIDDLDKMKFTESVQSELFGLLEHRISEGHYTFFSTNSTGKKLVKMFADHVGPAFIRRMVDSCESIDFDL